MNKILFSIIFAFIITTVVSHSRVLGQEEEFTAENCFPKIIGMYTKGSDPYDIEHDSVKATLHQSYSCSNMVGTCCSDDQFNEMTQKTAVNLNEIRNVIEQFKSTAHLVKNIGVNDLELIQNSLSDENKKEFDEVFVNFKNDYNKLISGFNSMFNLTTKYSAGLNCAVCNSYNHQQILNDEEDPRLIMNIDFCRSGFEISNLEGVLNYVEGTSSAFKLLNRFGNLYNAKFGEDPEIKENFRSYIQKQASDCLKDDNMTKNEQCIEFCFEVYGFNMNFFKNLKTEISTFIVVMNDFLGDKQLLNDAENRKNILEFKIEDIEKQISKEEILEPESKTNLNTLKIKPDQNGGWNLEKYGMKSWSRYVKPESEGLFLATTIFMLVSLLKF